MAALGPKLSIDDIQVQGKAVLVRVDFNVPMKDGKITDDFRITSSLPTIQKIIDNGGRAILMSHLGRPEGKGFEEKLSLKPIAEHLKQLLGKEVAFASDCMNADKEVSELKAGGVLLLENLRFYPNEGSSQAEERQVMAQKLASYGDVFVSDAFGTAHRDAASMTGVPKIMGQGAAGYLMKKEIDYFTKALKSPAKPVVAILGGAKVSDKIQLIEHMLKTVDVLIIGGAMAYTFLKANGVSTGSSKVETEADSKKGKLDLLKLALDIQHRAKEKNIPIHLPIDHRTADKFEDKEAKVTSDDKIPDGQMALDIGPKTEELFVNAIKQCKTAIWNGPMGVAEFKNFQSGTYAIARTLAEHQDILSIVGGGDSAAAAEKSGYADKLSHISTGGGASLELMEGKVLPGVAVLTDKASL